MAHAAQLAGIAIERCDAAEALRTSEAQVPRPVREHAEGVYQSRPTARCWRSIRPSSGCSATRAPRRSTRCPAAASLYWDPAERAEFVQALERAGEIHNAEIAAARPRRPAAGGARERARRARRCSSVRRLRGHDRQHHRAQARRAGDLRREGARAGDAAVDRRCGHHAPNRDGRIEYINPVAEQLSGWRGAEARGETIMEVLHLRDEITHEPIENPLLRACARTRRRNFGDHTVLHHPPRPGGRDPGVGGADPRSQGRASSARWWCSTTSPRSGA